MCAKVLTELADDDRRFKETIISEPISIIGYGNQGRSQALNLRDSGYTVLIGNLKDSYRQIAESDGFKVYDIETAVKLGRIVFVLIPDEIQPKVFSEYIQPHLEGSKAVVFASAYNYYYGYVRPQQSVDILLIAPRMIGWGLRDLYLKRKGFPILGAVGQDYSKKAGRMLNVLSEGIGALLPGGCIVESTFKEETLLDLLSEQSWAGAVLFMFRAYYDTVVAMGCSPEAAILEMYGSGELVEIVESMKEKGLFKQLATHSHTSQYGQLTRGPLYVSDSLRSLMERTAKEILDGTFAREWMSEQAAGMKKYEALHLMNMTHPMESEEEKLYKKLGRSP